MKLRLRLLIALSLTPLWSAANPVCQELFKRGIEAKGSEAAPQKFRPGKVPQDKRAYFNQVINAIESRAEKLSQILLKYNNVPGTKLELEIVRRQLREEIGIELFNMENTPTLKNIAVYASTNVPLYTLVSHGLMAKALAENVWFRTPETTRDVYLELFRELESALPLGTLDGLNLLTESREVQYDNFNKIYVMGMNKKGTKSLRAPSELVVFTGNPETAHKIIDSNQRRIHEDAARLGIGAFKQVFLGFGAGINPIIVPPSASGAMARVVHQSMEPIRINNGQDCMAADFYAVHRSVLENYVGTLLTEVRALQPGSNEDPKAGYTPLTMNKNFGELKAYREKYAKYLRNPEATINEETKLVSPHVFVFPYEMFQEVSLQEHFGPFFTIFRYDNNQQLEAIARDERVQKKAMYATILAGDTATPDIQSARQIFQGTRHFVLVNETLFGDVHANMPFGGKGPSASMIVNLNYDGNGGLVMTTGHRPKLISTEANIAFGAPKIPHRPALRGNEYFAAYLKRTLLEAGKPPAEAALDEALWKKLRSPQTTPRARGLKSLREVIKREGLFIATNDAADAAFERLHGAPGLTERARNGVPAQVKGVVLHPGSVGEGPGKLNDVRGTINPHLGWGNLHGLLENNKFLEYHLAEAIQPGIMAHTENFASLTKDGVFTPAFGEKLAEMRRRIDTTIAGQRALTAAEGTALTEGLTELLDVMFKDLRGWFPEGAYLKGFGDFGTADLGTQITTFSTPAKALATEFVRRLNTALSEKFRGTTLAAADVQKLMLKNQWEIAGAFVNKLLVNEKGMLAQSRVKIAKTAMGMPLEFRVDFLDGEPVSSRCRFTTEYLAEESRQAAAVLTQFFEKAPEEMRYLSGGADIARLEDGSWVIVEFNFGNTSGTLSPRYFPIESNLLISSIKGTPTPLIAELENVFSTGAGAQTAYLKKLKHVRPLFWKAYGLEDLSVAEAGKYFRDRELDAWTAAGAPNPIIAQDTLGRIRAVLEEWNTQEDVARLIRGAEMYVNTRLKRHDLESKQPK